LVFSPKGTVAGLIDFEEFISPLRQTNFYMSPGLLNLVRRKLSAGAGEA